MLGRIGFWIFAWLLIGAGVAQGQQADNAAIVASLKTDMGEMAFTLAFSKAQLSSCSAALKELQTKLVEPKPAPEVK